MFACTAVYICILCMMMVINHAVECDTSWTDITSTFTIPNEIDSLFIPFKLSNYLFVIGTSTTSEDEDILIYYHNLNNYTSLLSSLYDKTKVDFKSFKNELNNVVSQPLKWNLLGPGKQTFSESNDTIYPFLSYPSTYFLDERSNDIYIIAPIETSIQDEINSNSFNSDLWKLHIDIKSSLLPSSGSNVDMRFYWENMGDLLYPLSSSCVVYDEQRDIAFIFGGIDENGRTSDKVQAYNLLNDTWTSKTKMNSPRKLSSCSMFGDDNNFIYVFGGNGIQHYGTIEMYDIDNNKWTQLDDDIIFPFTRYATSAIQLQKRDAIYIIGGLLNYDTATSRIGIFDPYNNSLEICKESNNTLPYNRGAATSLVIADTIWTFGGYSNLNGNNLQFDPTITIGISYNEYLYDVQEHINPNLIDNNGNESNVHSVFGIITIDIAIIVLIVSLYCLLCMYFLIKCCINKQRRNKESISMSLLNPEMEVNRNQYRHTTHGRDDSLSIQRQSSSEMTEMGLRSLNSLSPSFPPIIPSYFDNNDQIRRSSSKQMSSNQITSFNRSSATSVTATQQYQPILHLPSITLNTPSRHNHNIGFNGNGSKTISHAPLLSANNYDSTQKQRVINWLKHDVGLSQYVDNFFSFGFDRMIFVENITDGDLIDMKIKKPGHRKRILQQIKGYTKKQQQLQLSQSNDQSRSFFHKSRKNNSISQPINVSKSMSALTKSHRNKNYHGPGNGHKYKTRQKHAKSANHLRGVPSSESITDYLNKTFDSSDLYLSNDGSMDNDGDGDSLYINDDESKDGDQETDLMMNRSSTTTAIRGSDDDDTEIHKFCFNPNPTQSRRNRTRKRYRRHRNSSQDSTTSLSSVTSSNLSFDGHGHYNKYMPPSNNKNKHTFDSQATFTMNEEFSPSASPSSLTASSSSGSRIMHEAHLNMIQQPIHPPVIMSTASIQSAMKAAYSTLDGPPNDDNDTIRGRIMHGGSDSMMSDIECAVMDINDISLQQQQPLPHKSSVSSSMSGIWDSPKHRKNKSQISQNESSKTNNNSVEGASPTGQLGQ